jgi:hypothetical protein
LVSLLFGAEVPSSVPLNSLVRVKLSPDEVCFVLAKDFTSVDTEATTSGLVFTGPAGKYAILVVDSATKQTQTLSCEIGTAPTPVPPGPTPNPIVPPSGLAGDIYRAALAINDPAKSLRYAQSYETVSSQIGAGALQTIEQVRNELIRANRELQSNPPDPRWKAVGDTIAAALGQDPSVPRAKTIIDQVAVGLRLAGGGQ